MYRIAICDDDKEFIDYIKKIIIELGMNYNNTEYYEYESGELFINALKKNIEYSLIILSVELKNMKSYDLAFKIREIYKDTILVFCSGIYEPNPISFKTMPFRYLLKEYSREKMVKEVREIINYMKKNEKKIEVHYNCIKFKSSIDKIYYISIAKRGSVIHTSKIVEQLETDCFICDERMIDIYNRIKEFGFSYAHNSYIVNLKYIKINGANELEFPNGEKLTISRSKIQEFRTNFAKYLEK